MSSLKIFLLITIIAAFSFLVVGLFKPWLMLWWEDIQNRRKVIKLYGGITILSAVLFWLLTTFTL